MLQQTTNSGYKIALARLPGRDVHTEIEDELRMRNERLKCLNPCEIKVGAGGVQQNVFAPRVWTSPGREQILLLL
jgi:hypothetical protein